MPSHYAENGYLSDIRKLSSANCPCSRFGNKVLNRERVRFEVAGGNYRLVAAFDFRRQIAFVKLIGTHAEYDRIDASTVSQL